ncbi:hypothetical protein [Vibrio barjaei]|uniref:hypothetical protein n=1 Tax=Vibrio barjaei TaxID=1676683 RepID=UPI0022836BE2|nr:hypothetical protein [Vibrio barjaei]MCY9871806.1 hypothetical protein [Vibrio barjaei]
MTKKLKDLTYHNWRDYHAYLYAELGKAKHFDIYPTTAEVLIHKILGLPNNQIHEILVAKFPDKKFNKQYVKAICWKYQEIINEYKEQLK